ncbi:nitroreductase family protein [Seleniivibrio woodruffii]|uniref:nitroreductase family protein n=1 Tax=Seleniivibrio woodruffii TaxID=1078050 RepID=UPI0026EF57AC|nr:nitroreductase family protein [Seleniivibrio woodruffii]
MSYQDFLNSVKARRTYYGISNEKVVEESVVEDIVKQAVLHAPSAFNSQSARVLVLFGKEHDKLWEIVRNQLHRVAPAAQVDGKIDSFKAGYGTVLYFEDQTVIKGLQEAYAAYADNFPVWSNHSGGMLQFIVWTALEQAGLGASLQHYGQLIEGDVQKEWGVPASWSLLAQMPFGKPVADPGEKQFSPIEERVKIYR